MSLNLTPAVSGVRRSHEPRRSVQKRSQGRRHCAGLQGRLNVAGIEHSLSGWVKTSKTGTKYLSLSLRPKELAPAKKAPGKDFDDNIGF